jgi:hypothetical protein
MHDFSNHTNTQAIRVSALSGRRRLKSGKKLSQLQNVGGLKRLAGFCASQAGIFGNFRNFWRCGVDFGRSFSVACPRSTELNCQR